MVGYLLRYCPPPFLFLSTLRFLPELFTYLTEDCLCNHAWMVVRTHACVQNSHLGVEGQATTSAASISCTVPLPCLGTCDSSPGVLETRKGGSICKPSLTKIGWENMVVCMLCCSGPIQAQAPLGSTSRSLHGCNDIPIGWLLKYWHTNYWVTIWFDIKICSLAKMVVDFFR